MCVVAADVAVRGERLTGAASSDIRRDYLYWDSELES